MRFKIAHNDSIGDVGAEVSQGWPEKNIISRKGK